MKDKSNMLKKLKSIFIIEEAQSSSVPTAQTTEQPGTEEKKPTSDPVLSVQRPAVSRVSSDKGDNKFNQILLKVLEDNNIDGFDYLEFKNSVLSLSKAIPDEATQFKSAYEVGKTMGVTKEKLLDTARHYARMLEQEESKFQQAFENQKQQQLHGREEDIKKHEAEIVSIEKKIQDLNESIHHHNKTIEELRKAMVESAEKLSQTHGAFHSSYVKIHDKITSDITKIQNLLT